MLIVGIIIRSNTNESNLDQIFKQIRKINHDRNMSKTKVISGHFLSGTSSSFDADVMFHKELTPARRILYRGIMGAVPALCSTFLTQKVIGYLSTASGFLAPPFVIIFPCLLTIALYRRGAIFLNKFWYILLWVYLIVFGFGSYIVVILNIFYGSAGGA